VGTRVDVLHGVEKSPVGADNEGPTLGIPPTFVNHPIGSRDLLVWVAQNGIVEIEGLGETTVGSCRITTRRKEGDIVLVEAGPGGCRKVDLLSTLELDDE
jgi:hypothetical protein